VKTINHKPTLGRESFERQWVLQIYSSKRTIMSHINERWSKVRRQSQFSMVADKKRRAVKKKRMRAEECFSARSHNLKTNCHSSNLRKTFASKMAMVCSPSSSSTRTKRTGRASTLSASPSSAPAIDWLAQINRTTLSSSVSSHPSITAAIACRKSSNKPTTSSSSRSTPSMNHRQPTHWRRFSRRRSYGAAVNFRSPN